MSSKISKSVDTFINNAIKSLFVILYLTRKGLLVIPLSIEEASGLTISSKVIIEVVTQQKGVIKKLWEECNRLRVLTSNIVKIWKKTRLT